MAATVPKLRRRTRTTDPAGRLTLRLGEEQLAFLAAEAGKARLATAEYVRNLIVRGMRARELHATVAEVRAMLPEFRATEGGGTEVSRWKRCSRCAQCCARSLPCAIR